MNQGEIIITYRVDSSGAITAISNVQKKMHESERNLNSTQSKYGKFFDRLKALEKLGAGGEHETGAKQLFDAISNSARAVNDKENGN